MKKKRFLAILAIVVLFAVIAVGVVSADDGEMFRRNISKTPDQETERANLAHMTFYVPAQNSTGELVSSGVYFYRIQADTFTATKKLVVLK